MKELSGRGRAPTAAAALAGRDPDADGTTNDAQSSEAFIAQAPKVELRDAVRGFDTPAGRVTPLKGVSLQVEPAEFVAIVGKSGSGKSALLNLLAGLDRPTAGSVIVDGIALEQLDDESLARWRAQNVGIVLQTNQLFGTLTSLQNVQLAIELAGVVPRDARTERASEALSEVGMLNYADSRPAKLSPGQRKRVAIAQALANDPPLLLADEPTGTLDSVRAEAVFRLFGRLAEAGKTVIMATHDHELASRARRAVVLSDGHVVSQYVATALATLDLVQLNAAAQSLKPIRYGPRQVVVRQGERADRFFIITRGEAEVLLERPDGPPVQVATLRAGEYFGEIALLRGGTRTATVRAVESGLDVMTLGKDVFANVVDHSGVTRETIDAAIRQRLDALATA